MESSQTVRHSEYAKGAFEAMKNIKIWKNLKGIVHIMVEKIILRWIILCFLTIVLTTTKIK